MKNSWLFALLLLFALVPVTLGQFQGNRNDARAGSITPNPLPSCIRPGTVFQSRLDSAGQFFRQKNWNKFLAEISNLALKIDSISPDSSCVLLSWALARLAQAGQSEGPTAASLYNNIAYYSRRAERYAAALEAYDRAIDLFKKNGALGARPAYAYKNVAQIFLRRSDYTRSTEYLEAALRVDTGGDLRADTYAQLANNYHYMGDEKAVMRCYQQGMAEAKRNEKATAFLESNGASAFAAFGEFETASRMLARALAFFEKDLDNHALNQLRCRSALAWYAEQQGKPALAAKYFETTETVSRKAYPGKNRETAKIYQEWGDFLLRCGQRNAALTKYQQALIQVFPDFNDSTLAANPSSARGLVESYCMTAPVQKALALLNVSRPALAERRQAAACFDLALEAAANLRRGYSEETDKLLLAHTNRHWHQRAALNLFHIAQMLPGHERQQAFARLFQWGERTHAQALQDQLRQQRGLLLAGIPDSLLKKEERLRLEANEAGLRLETISQKDSLSLPERKEQLLRSRRAHDQFFQQLQRNFPSFGALHQENVDPDMATIQQQMSDSTLLLEYLDAGDSLLVLAVGKTGFDASVIAQDTGFQNLLSSYLTHLTDKTWQEQNPGILLEQAFQLGRSLLPSTLAGTGIKSLWIVPDGRLCYLPFETLLTASPRESHFGNAPWLVRRCAIRYGWAANMLTGKPLPSATAGLLHCAPFLSRSRNGLPVLVASAEECPPGRVTRRLADERALAASFWELAPGYSVLHLSTHAQAGRQAAPGVEFADRQVSLPELYGRQFRTELVSLSACETGAGQIAAGEGVLSLARGFAYAGARSLVASYWLVNDRATARLFRNFYEVLNSGVPRAEALRQAKLQMLDDQIPDARKAPYYWAAFTLSGADGPLVITKQVPWWYWFIAGAATVGIAWRWWIGRNRKHKTTMDSV